MVFAFYASTTFAWADPPPPPPVASPPVTAPAPTGPPTTHVADADTATHAATSARLVGSACSYTTSLMARRVMEQGSEWSAEGALVASPAVHDSLVAAPYTLASDDSVHVLATDFLEALLVSRAAGPTLALTGRQMEVSGVRYVVLLSYREVTPP